MNRSNSSKVIEFTSLFTEIPDIPNALDDKKVEFICRMITSEMLELISTVSDDPVTFFKERCMKTDLPTPSISSPNHSEETQKIAEQADAFGDIMYYMYDTCVRNGIHLDYVFEEIHRANMSKRFPDGKLHQREDGKVIKPPHFQEADINNVIKTQQDYGSWNLN